jgi:TfoX/Sxy family transcriptional regulator of competence genes
VSDERWAQLCQDNVDGPVTVGSMFGSKGLRTGPKFFAIWWHSQLVLKLPAERIDQLVRESAAEPFVPMEGRPMTGWVVVEAAAGWDQLAAESRAYVESLQR